MMKRATSTRRTKKGATIQERKRKDGTIQRKRTNADGSIRNSRRNTDGTLKSATRKTTAGGTVKSMRRGGEFFGKKSERVQTRNTAAGIAAKKARMAKNKAARMAARKAKKR
jgi:hypothetical protein